MVVQRAHQTNFFYYFAYGSNLLAERIRVQNKGAEFHCVGVLRNFHLTFLEYGTRWKGGVASILESANEEVWGCVWRVPHEYAEELDRQEYSYHRLEVPVHTDDEVIECRTYQFTDKQAAFQAPSPHYKTVIVTGAAEHKLPEAYLKKLGAIADNGFIGKVNVDLDCIRHLQVEVQA